jgi:hypothetical protein
MSEFVTRVYNPATGRYEVVDRQPWDGLLLGDPEADGHDPGCEPAEHK